jgi:hypothetical protein
MAAAFMMFGCSSYYQTVKQTGTPGGLTKYPSVNVGWVDLGEDLYKDYGFEEKDKGQWTTLINDMNQKSMPEFLKGYLGDKPFKTVKAKGEKPAAEGLVVEFTDVKYNQQTSSGAQIAFGSLAGSDTLDATVHFIDGASGKELYATTVSISTKAGAGYGSMGFEGRVNNAFSNLARYISEEALK